MAADIIDSLGIELRASSQKANTAIDSLISKLGALQTSLASVDGSHLAGLGKGVSSLASGMQQMKGVGEAKFTNLANGINRLSAIDTASLNRSASALRQITTAFAGISQASQSVSSVSTLTSSLSKLGNKGVTNAIANIPQLANALKQMMATLSTAPRVSSNLIQMTNAMANLSSQGQKTSSATKGIANAFKTYDSSVTRSTSITNRLSSAIGRMYQQFFYIRRAFNALKSSVKASMDYIETLNYFDAAFGQVAQNAVSDWKEAGYQSAQAYYDSFAERAKKVTGQMSGYNIKDNGMLEYTGSTSLGIDPNKLMNYQATFGQMASSIGVTSENSLILSRALTEIGADLASVKNMDFDKVWKDMASGLVGMSRTLDKYGVNIRLVNLQQQLSNIGINANIQNLNQQEKAMLRTILLLNSTKYAWGDLADTINQPANQVRLLQANFHNLSRTIGNLFLPVVAGVLPYINGLTIALQRFFTWIGKIAGIDVSSITSAVGDSALDMSEFLDDTEGVADALDDADKNAKKLKNTTNTIGIDKLNIIQEKSDTSSSKDKAKGLGAGDMSKLNDAFLKAYEEYQKAWDKAFAGVDGKAQKIADKIVKAFKKGDYKGIGTYISSGITGALNSIPWESVYKVATGFGSGFAQFLNGLITPELFYSTGKTIASALNTAIYTALAFFTTFDFANYGDSIASGINGFFENFDFKALAETLNAWADGLYLTIEHAISNIHWTDVLKGIWDFTSNLELSTVVMLVGFGKFKRALKGMLSLAGIKKVFIGLANGLYRLFSTVNTMAPLVGTALKTLGGAGVFLGGLTAYKSGIKGLSSGMGGLAKNLVNVGGGATVAFTALKLIVGLSNPVSAVVTGIGLILETIWGYQEGLTEKENERIRNLGKLTKKEQELCDEIHNEYDAYQLANEERQKTFDDINIAYDSAQKYVDELRKIVDENGNIKKGYEDRAKVLSEQINDKLGTEITIVDGQIKKYKKLQKEIDKTIAKKRLEALVDANQDAYTEAQREVNNSYKKYRSASDKVDETTADINKRKKALRKAQAELNVMKRDPNANQGDIADKIREVDILAAEIESKQGKLEEFTTAMGEAEAKWVGYKATIENQEKAMEVSVTGTAKQMDAAAANISSNFISAQSGTLDTLKNQRQTAYDEWQQMLEDSKDKNLNITDEMLKAKKDAYISADKALQEKEKEMGLEHIPIQQENGRKSIKAYVDGINSKGKNGEDAVKKAGENAANRFSDGFSEKIKSLPDKVKAVFENLFSGEIMLKAKAEVDKNKLPTGTFWDNNIKIVPQYAPTHANGGFAEDGFFFANHNELVGKFSNGKTAVANNQMITDGIEEASYRGYMRAFASINMSDTGSSKQRIEIPVMLNGKEITRVVNEENAKSGAKMIGYESGY